jgi:L-2-hydroxyglutarate oxidase LhgO
MEKMLERKQINVQSNTPVLSISDEKDSEGYFTVTTKRGEVKAKTIVHANVSSRLNLYDQS